MNSDTGRLLRRIVMLGTPALFVIVSLLHPVLRAPRIMEDLQLRHGVWMGVHVAQLFLFGLLGLTLWFLLEGLHGKAATLSRLALIPFLVFYTAFDSLAGVGTGLLARKAEAIAGPERVIAVSLVQQFWDALLDPESPTMYVYLLGNLSWLVAVIAAAVALRGAGASRAAVALLVLAGLLFGFDHHFPTGTAGMLCLLSAIVIIHKKEYECPRSYG